MKENSGDWIRTSSFDGNVSSVAERLVFLGGLHRSGTSPLARWLAEHPDVSRLTGTGVPEDEGQHLQSIYPIAAAHGGPGRFALDPRARLTEESPLATPDSARSLLEAWAPYWDLSKQALVEKSPPNLIRVRFLRALFPAARFIILVRHPIAVAVATRKWRRASMDDLLRHWATAHAHLTDDAAAVGQLALIRYEDLMTDTATQLERIFEFLSLAPHPCSWPVRAGLNDAYFARFSSPRWPGRRMSNARAAQRHDHEVARFGYSLIEPGVLHQPAPEIEAIMCTSGTRAAPEHRPPSVGIPPTGLR